MNVKMLAHWRSRRAETYPMAPMSVSRVTSLPLVALAYALAYSGAVAGAQERLFAGVSALDGIRRLRPRFLRSRRAEVARQALVLPVVYLDGMKLGELRTLESIHLRSVLEIQYSSPTEATMRWGLGHEGGVIHVMSRRA